MPFKSKEREKEVKRLYRSRNKDKIRAYMKKYCARPEVKERVAKYYLAHRDELIKSSTINKTFGKYERKPIDKKKNRLASCKYARRKKHGVVVSRDEKGFFWKAGKLWNGYFDYKRDAIKDAEAAFCL